MATRPATNYPGGEINQKLILQQLFFVSNSDMSIIRSFLEKIPNKINEYPELLAWAIIAGNTEVVKFILSEGTSLDQPPATLTSGGSGRPEYEILLQSYRRSPYIVLAGAAGHVPVMEILLENGRNTLETGHIGFSKSKNNIVIGNVIQAAIFYDKLDLVRWLLSNFSNAQLGLEAEVLEQKGNPGRGNFQKEYHKCTALMLAVYRSSVDVVREILIKQVKVGANDWQGNNALHIAVNLDRPDVVQVLLDESPIDVYARNAKGNSALSLARERGLAGIMQILDTKVEDSSKQIAEELINQVLDDEAKKEKKKKRRRPNNAKQQVKPPSIEQEPEPVKVEVEEEKAKVLTIVSLPPPPKEETKVAKPVAQTEAQPQVDKKQAQDAAMNKAARRKLQRQQQQRKDQKPEPEEQKKVEEEVKQEEVKQEEVKKEEPPQKTAAQILGGVGLPLELIKKQQKRKRRNKKTKEAEIAPLLTVPPPPRPEPEKELTPEEKLNRLEKRVAREKVKSDRTISFLEDECAKKDEYIKKLTGEADYSTLRPEEIEELRSVLTKTLEKLS